MSKRVESEQITHLWHCQRINTICLQALYIAAAALRLPALDHLPFRLAYYGRGREIDDGG
jgi:hypothetical protein